MNLFPYTMQFLCWVTTHHGEGASFCVSLCDVQFIFHFLLLALNCACLSALQYCNCEASAYKSTCYSLFTRTKQHTLSPRYAAIHALQLRSKPEASMQLLAVRMVNNGTSESRWRHGTNVFGPADLVSCIACVPATHAQKALNFELRLFKKCRVGIAVK